MMLGSDKTRGFFKNSLILMAGTAMAQLIPLLLSPILSRLFSPADLAVFGLYSNAVSMFAVVFTLRYEMTIVLPKERRDANNLVGLSVLIAIGLGILFLIPCFFLNDWICHQLKNKDFHTWLYLVPLSMTLVGIYQAFNYFLTREKAFTGSAINRITQKVGEGSTNLAAGYSGIHGGLALGDLTGRAAVVVMAYFQALKAGFQFNEIHWKEMKVLAKRYWEFAVIGTGPALLNSISLNLPIFFISSFFDGDSTGQFNWSRMFLAFPLSIISANIAQVLLQRISEQRNAGKPVMKEIRKIFLMLITASVSLAIILQFTAPWIFSTIFGAKWMIAGKYSAILAIAFAARFAVSPMNVVFTAFEKVRAFSLWQIFYAVLIASMYFLRHLSMEQFLWAYTLIDLISYSVCLLLVYRTLKEVKA